MSEKIAFLYDFDRTLCTRDMQEYGFIPGLGMDPASFWKEVSRQSEESDMDPILSYMYYMVEKSSKLGKPVRREQLSSLGKDIELFPGVRGWFRRIGSFAQSLGLSIDHYVISSGLQEIIEGTSIAPCFTRIYASQFHYDESGNADWPSLSINFTNKTQFLFRIHKGTFSLSDDRINEYMPEEEAAYPWSRILYFGDGMTDVPCMSLVKRNGGTSIAVYSDQLANACRLVKDGRVNYSAEADYQFGSALDTIVRKVLSRMALEEELAGIQERENAIISRP